MKQIKKEAQIIAKYYYDWLEECIGAYSSHTIANYKDTMCLYMLYLEENKICPENLSATSFARENIVDWIEWLKKRRNSTPQTCNNRLASLRAFIKYLSARDPKYLTLWMNASTIKRQETQDKAFEYISPKAIGAVLSTPNPQKRTDYKYMVLMSFLYITAARIDEALSIKLKDLRLDNKHPYVMVSGKGNKQRVLSLSPKIVEHLKKYIKMFHGDAGFEEDSFLWFSQIKGKQFKASQEGVNKKIAEYANKAHIACNEVPLNLHAHSFRHARATHLLENGMSIYQLSKYLGHEHIQTTSIYISVSPMLKAQMLSKLEAPETAIQTKKWNRNGSSLLSLFGLQRNR